MKNLTVVGLLMLGLGFCLGWLVKPLTVVDPAVQAISGKPAVASVPEPIQDAPPPGKHAIREAPVTKTAGTPSEAQMNQAKTMQAEMSKKMVDGLRAKFTTRIERLAENLDLTADQEAQLTAWLDGQMKEMGNLDISGSGFAGNTRMPTEKSMEEQLALSLSAGQKDALQEFKGREHQSKVDTTALKSLSKLQGIIQFEEGQRDEVYKVLTESAEASLLAEDDKPDVTKMFTEGMGIEMDPYDLGLAQAMSSMRSDPTRNGESPASSQEMAKTIRETVDKRIDDKVEQLRPVLNDRQLELYRNELKTKGLGVYGPMLMGMEKGSD